MWELLYFHSYFNKFRSPLTPPRMAGIACGNLAFPTKSAFLAWLHENFDRMNAGEHVDAAVVDAWLGPLLRAHPEAARKLEGWTGRVYIDRFRNHNRPLLVREDGRLESISWRKCVRAL